MRYQGSEGGVGSTRDEIDFPDDEVCLSGVAQKAKKSAVPFTD